MFALTKCLKFLLIFPLVRQNAQPARSSPFFVDEIWPPQTGGHPSPPIQLLDVQRCRREPGGHPSPPQVGSQLESFLPGHGENQGRHRRPTHDTILLHRRVVGNHGSAMMARYKSTALYKRPWQDAQLQHHATQELRA